MIPITRRPVSEIREAAIRHAVQALKKFPVSPLSGGADATIRLATLEDAAAFCLFLKGPGIHQSVYTLPRQLDIKTITHFIHEHVLNQEKGEGLLLLSYDRYGDITGYTDLCFWPQWAAGEVGGALRADQQNKRQGINGAARMFEWMFEGLGLALICETASLENVRTARLLDHLGFTRKGQVTSHLEDGTTRSSLVWELTHQEWKIQGFSVLA